MNTNEHTLLPIENFEKLRQTDMVLELRKADPARARGKSRATKETLTELYRAVIEERLVSAVEPDPDECCYGMVVAGNQHSDDCVSTNTATGRLRSDQPNISVGGVQAALAAFKKAGTLAPSTGGIPEGRLFSMKVDPYGAAAAALYGVEYDAVTPQQRQGAKDALLPHIFGMSCPSEADPHTAAAAKMFAVPESEVTEEQRTTAKVAILKHHFGDFLSPEEDIDLNEVMLKTLGMVSPTGRLASNKPNLQRPPLRTAEGREIAEAFAEKDMVVIEGNYSAYEAMMEERLGRPEKSTDLVVGGAVMDAFDAEKPYGGLPTDIEVVAGKEHTLSTGADYHHMSDQVVGVVSRRDVVMRAVAKLGRDKIMMLARYKSVPEGGNRRTRKIRDSLFRQIRRFLPKGVTIDEAVAVL